MFIVILTTFHDDYKCRGEDWSQNWGIKLFNSRQDAENYLKTTLIEYMYEDEYNFDYDDYQNIKNMTDTDFFEFIENHVKGKFIPRCLSWEILEREVEF